MTAPFRILEKVGDNVTDIAVCDGGRLVEAFRVSDSASGRVGSVYIGRVERVLPKVHAAFVELGFPRNGFLPIRESDSFHALNGDAPLITGSEALVQVQKEEIGEKGVFLTRDVSLPGRYVVVMPMNRFIGVSKRVSGEPDKKRLCEMGNTIARNRFGLILREASLNATEDAVRGEAEELFSRWEEASRGWQGQKAPRLLYAPADGALSAVRDYSGRHEVAFLTNRTDADGSIPDAELSILWRNLRVDGQIRAAMERKVPIPGGGTLVIDEREALQTIDVNSGAETLPPEGESLAFSVNRAAVEEIARQIRLRNLSGIIIIDFMDMDTDREREEILAAMETALADDRVKHVIHGFTRLGLLEMTRKRSGRRLWEMFPKQN